eukprot:318700-Chlamydomonas_euryale.AAC.1
MHRQVRDNGFACCSCACMLLVHAACCSCSTGSRVEGGQRRTHATGTRRCPRDMGRQHRTHAGSDSGKWVAGDTQKRENRKRHPPQTHTAGDIQKRVNRKRHPPPTHTHSWGHPEEGE